VNAHGLVLFGIGIPVAAMFGASLVGWAHRRTASACLQLIGAAGLVMVVLIHVAEALHWLPWMGWGQAHSAGHYLDLASAVLGVTLLLGGYLAGVLTKLAVNPRAREKPEPHG
jgi:hypothetical protein